ncbi:MAG: hypothetical protein SGI97_09295 [candidate division Zixibacteria bacterium]|nr:hypothetical protein [candidate division Zixibacteria bacterium]
MKLKVLLLNSWRVVALTLAVSFIAGCSFEPERGTPEYYEKYIDSFLDSLAANSSSALRDNLALWPADIVVPALTSALDSNPNFQTDQARASGYSLLQKLKAYETVQGRALYVKGLNDNTKVAQQSISSLILALPTYGHEVIPALTLALLNDSLPETLHIEIIRGLLNIHYQGDSLVGRLTQFFSDTSLHEALRTTAMQGILAFGGAEAALPLLNNLDTTGHKAAIFALGHFGGVTGGTLSATPEVRENAREFVLSSMTHPVESVRIAAFRSLSGLYGKEWFVERDGVYALNDDIKPAIRKMIKAEPDAAKRERLEKELVLLDQHEQRQKK